MTTTTGLPDVPGYHWRIRGNPGDLLLELVKGPPRSRWLRWTQSVSGSDYISYGYPNEYEIPDAAQIRRVASKLVVRHTGLAAQARLTGTYPPKTLDDGVKK